MRIQSLEIYSPNLEAQKNFYANVLGLELMEQSASELVFRIGNSQLKITARKDFTPYHYAINIPCNQEQEAADWLRDRVEMLKYEQKEIQFFEHWNAYAIYFYDADNNIGELIARKSLMNSSNEPFGSESLLEISEIGIPTFDIEKEYSTMKQVCNLPIYSGSFERFCAVGDEHGLFITINKELKKQWFPTEDPTISSDFAIKFVNENVAYEGTYQGAELLLQSNGQLGIHESD